MPTGRAGSAASQGVEPGLEPRPLEDRTGPGGREAVRGGQGIARPQGKALLEGG
ncbi:MAG TPA: hypothetical protein VLT32_02575 [Candidatus Sulfomarinibacteraceae bacterium]|nr:hypothetical protein [Candidatus Sulfomarinibacteraceae bacterium]